jgi:hypothetical protein
MFLLVVRLFFFLVWKFGAIPMEIYRHFAVWYFSIRRAVSHYRRKDEFLSFLIFYFTVEPCRVIARNKRKQKILLYVVCIDLVIVSWVYCNQSIDEVYHWYFYEKLNEKSFNKWYNLCISQLNSSYVSRVADIPSRAQSVGRCRHTGGWH